MSRKTESIQSMEGSVERICALVADKPHGVLTWRASQEDWSILQILSHIREALPYWLNQLQLAQGSEDRPWGRGLTDPSRLAAVENTESLNVPEIVRQIRTECQKCSETLMTMNESAFDVVRTSRNPKFGTKSLWFIVDHMMVEHLQKHCGQIERTIQRYEKTTP
jgi:uncharacterized damage-inducible protein DinB